jgi:BirA family biotin operon repressor/biotin-[acetyl-CoA-carboxylase] ligase
MKKLPRPAPEVLIIEALLAAGAGHVSGTALARQLGVSRVAVWQQMEKLRAQGFAFESVRARGYRLSACPAALHPALIAAHLRSHGRSCPLMLLDEVDSTNDEAARQLADGRPAPFAVLARRQTRGRGRLGRAWHSTDNGNLYVSFAFRPRLAPARMQTFTLWMGVNVCELVANFTGATPGLKWPNDLLFDGRKAGGMLTEARMDADQIRDLVFGLGLNVNSPAGAWPRELAGRAISLYCDLIARAAIDGISRSQGSAGVDLGALEAPVEEAIATAPVEATPIESFEAPAEVFELLTAPRGAPDDLAKLQGVGPQIVKKLNDAGVFHYWQIAAMTSEDVAKLDADLRFNGRIERDGWVNQARSLLA